jgi:hypothetical protein
MQQFVEEAKPSNGQAADQANPTLTNVIERPCILSSLLFFLARNLLRFGFQAKVSEISEVWNGMLLR